ncbi:hypothetical protein AB0L00_23330 [Actinoallomurus sp. NPDC052308]|uniref:hypothetical protein n=1 Tax=Actinoallomurus sp. NPDC052308 TaxID=3155530 RepID=UPI00342544C0
MAAGTGRVTVDDVAVNASKTLLNILNSQLPNTITALNRAGTDLSNPQHWDGGDAIKFRGDIWPKVQNDLKQIQSALTDLQQSVDKVLGNILTAGGS